MNQQELLISIIVPFYNSESTIERCLDSLLSNSYKNLEIICVDSNSTDNTKEIIKEKYNLPNVFYYNSPNKGIAPQRSFGFSKASGDYITSVDSDDFVHPQTYEMCVDIIRQKNVDIVCFPFQYNVPNDTKYNSYPFSKYHVQSFNILNNNRVEYKFLLSSMYYSTLFSCCNKVVKRDITVASLKHYNANLPYITNEDTVYGVFVLSNSKTIALIDYPLYFYVENYESTSRNDPINVGYLKRIISNYNRVYNLFPKKYRKTCMEQFIQRITKYYIAVNISSGNSKIGFIYNQLRFINKDSHLKRILTYHNLKVVRHLFTSKEMIILYFWKYRLKFASSFIFKYLAKQK